MRVTLGNACRRKWDRSGTSGIFPDNLHANLSDAPKMSAASEGDSASKGAIQILVGLTSHGAVGLKTRSIGTSF